MKTRSEYLRNNLFFFDKDTNNAAKAGVWAGCPMLALNQDPNLGQVFNEDFNNFTGRNSSTFLGGYVTSLSSSGVLGIIDAEGGVLRLSADAVTVGHGITVQKVGETNQLASDKNFWFETKIKVASGASKALFFVGLAETDTDLMTSGSFDASTNYIGFGVETGGGGSLKLFSANGATEVSDVVANLTTGTYVRAGIAIDEDLGIRCYIDDAEVTLTNVVTTYLPDALMKPTFIVQSDGSSVNPSLDIDYVKIAQLK